MKYKFFLEKSAEMFLFSSFLAIFIITYLLGIKGFIVTPFLNIFQYLVVFLILIVFSLKNDNIILSKSLSLGVFIYLFLVLISFFIGLFNNNSTMYIVAWGGYFFSAVLCYIVAYSSSYCDVKSNNFFDDKIFNNFYLISILVILLIFFRSGFSFILILSILILNLFFQKKINLKIVCLILIVLCNFKYTDGGFVFNVARAGLISILGGVLVSLIYMRKNFKIFFFFFFLFLSYTFIVFSSQDFINAIPSRNLKEGAQLIRGDNIDDHVATAQRFYEADLVLDDYNNANLVEYLFGRGFGRTLDMTQSNDSSVGDAALEGSTEVNNVHFLPFAIFHKMGILGVSFLFFFFFYLLFIFFKDILNGKRSKTLLFCYIYLFSLILYAAPASNYLIANPFFALVFGYLVSFRKHKFMIN